MSKYTSEKNPNSVIPMTYILLRFGSRTDIMTFPGQICCYNLELTVPLQVNYLLRVNHSPKISQHTTIRHNFSYNLIHFLIKDRFLFMHNTSQFVTFLHLCRTVAKVLFLPDLTLKITFTGEILCIFVLFKTYLITWKHCVSLLQWMHLIAWKSMFLFCVIYLFRSIYSLPILHFSCRIADFYLKHSQAFSFKLCYSRQLWPDAVDGPEMMQDTESSETRQHYGVSVCVWMHECAQIRYHVFG